MYLKMLENNQFIEIHEEYEQFLYKKGEECIFEKVGSRYVIRSLCFIYHIFCLVTGTSTDYN